MDTAMACVRIAMRKAQESGTKVDDELEEALHECQGLPHPELPATAPENLEYAADTLLLHELNTRLERYAGELKHLQAQGFPINAPEELYRCQHYSQEAFDEHVADIKRMSGMGHGPVRYQADGRMSREQLCSFMASRGCKDFGTPEKATYGSPVQRALAKQEHEDRVQRYEADGRHRKNNAPVDTDWQDSSGRAYRGGTAGTHRGGLTEVGHQGGIAPFKLAGLRTPQRQEAIAKICKQAEEAAVKKGIPLEVCYEALAVAEREGISFEEALNRAIKAQTNRKLFGI
jgi:hypothetical protein